MDQVGAPVPAELFPQEAQARLDDRGQRRCAAFPDVLQDLPEADRPVGVADHVFEDLVLARRELEVSSAAEGPAFENVELEIVKGNELTPEEKNELISLLLGAK